MSHHKHHEFTPEESAILHQAFSLFESKDQIDAVSVAFILKSLDPSHPEHDIQSHVLHADIHEGLMVEEQFMHVMTTSWTSQSKTTGLIEKLEASKYDGSGFVSVLKKEFPGALQEADFVSKSYSVLHKLGFCKHHTIACVSLCRDEICKPLAQLLSQSWGETFDFSSLAGMISVGRTGMGAALHHSPQHHNVERYVFISMPHIAIDEYGNIGVVARSGRIKPSHACGALAAFKGECEKGQPNLNFDNEDAEYTLMKQKISKIMAPGSKPSLVELTILAQKTSLSDLENLISKCVDIKHANYAVISGVQIHGPRWLIKKKDMDYVWIAEAYSVVKGEKVKIKKDINY